MNQSLKVHLKPEKCQEQFFTDMYQVGLYFTRALRFLNGLFDSAELPGGLCLPHATKQWKECQKVEGVHGYKHHSEFILSAWMDSLPDTKF